MAHSVTVDNYTASWLQVQGVSRFCPPYTYGWIQNLIAGTQQANVAWTTPAGITAPTPGNGTADIEFSDDTTTPSNGFSVLRGAGADVGSTLLGQFNTTASSTITGGPYTIPTGATGVMAVWRTLTGGLQPTGIFVYNSDKSIIWGSTAPSTFSSGLNDTLLSAPVSAGIDPLVNVQVTEPSGSTHTVYVLALFQNAATTDTIAGSDVILPVNITQVGGNNWSSTALETVSPGGQVFFTSGTNAQITLVFNALASQSWQVHSVTTAFSSAPTGAPTAAIQSSGGASNLYAWTQPSTTPVTVTFPNGGAAIGANTGFQITLLAGGSGVGGLLSAMVGKLPV
jgi:hypothetical protein